MDKFFWIAIFALFICTGCGLSTKEKQIEKTQPNIVFIFADDQSYNMVHAFGNKELKTPSLDKLVNEGAAFTHTYNMGSWTGAVCVASRAMLNTGQFIWRAQKAVDKPNQLIKCIQLKKGIKSMKSGHTTLITWTMTTKDTIKNS